MSRTPTEFLNAPLQHLGATGDGGDDDVDVVPDTGQYFTFEYRAKTPMITYDRFPLVAVTSIYRWGFVGLNYHWDAFRRYTWEEITTNLYRIYPLELKTLRAIPYQYFTINN